MQGLCSQGGNCHLKKKKIHAGACSCQLLPARSPPLSGYTNTECRSVSSLQSTNFREPVQQLSQQQVEKMSLKYYNSDIHQAAFILPEFARKVSEADPPCFPHTHSQRLERTRLSVEWPTAACLGLRVPAQGPPGRLFCGSVLR